MKQEQFKPVKHVFVCVNKRDDGSPCCANVDGEFIFKGLKDYVRENGLAGSVWVTKTGCQGFCNDVGTTVTIHPDMLIFSQVKKEELPEIIKLINN